MARAPLAERLRERAAEERQEAACWPLPHADRYLAVAALLEEASDALRCAERAFAKTAKPSVQEDRRLIRSALS